MRDEEIFDRFIQGKKYEVRLEDLKSGGSRFEEASIAAILIDSTRNVAPKEKFVLHASNVALTTSDASIRMDTTNFKDKIQRDIDLVSNACILCQNKEYRL